MAFQEHPLQTQIIKRFKTMATECAHRIVVLVYAEGLDCTKGTKYYHRSAYTRWSELENEKWKGSPSKDGQPSLQASFGECWGRRQNIVSTRRGRYDVAGAISTLETRLCLHVKH